MTNFLTYAATKQLTELAKHPIDLTDPQNLSVERLSKFTETSCGFKFFFGTERVTEEVMGFLYSLAKESQALEKMAAMQSGEVINRIKGYPSEERAVLHTATRDFFQDQNSAPAAKEAAKQAKSELDKLKSFVQKIDEENKFTDLVLIGIGGSDLGPRAHYLALKYLEKPNRNCHFICNVDPDDAASVMQHLDLKKTLVVVVSKTGTTLETTTNEQFVKKYFLDADLNPRDHFISVSMPGSPLDNEKAYMACFHIWDWIGGRYSTTSMVGGVLLSFAFGFEVYWSLLQGANAMDKAALKTENNLPLLSALLGIWNRNFLGYPTFAIIPYSQALWRFTAHLQQLDMESNGKQIDTEGRRVNYQTGPVIWGEAGTNAQHSFFQLIHQGTSIIPLEFIGFKESQYQDDVEFEGSFSQEKLLANLLSQMIALATGKQDANPNKLFPGNRPSHLIVGKKLTPYALGVLLSYFEHKVAFQGFIWGINSFDQEGVQLGKVLANRVLRSIIGKRKKTTYEPFPEADALLNQIEEL